MLTLIAYMQYVDYPGKQMWIAFPQLCTLDSFEFNVIPTILADRITFQWWYTGAGFKFLVLHKLERTSNSVTYINT